MSLSVLSFPFVSLQLRKHGITRAGGKMCLGVPRGQDVSFCKQQRTLGENPSDGGAGNNETGRVFLTRGVARRLNCTMTITIEEQQSIDAKIDSSRWHVVRPEY